METVMKVRRLILVEGRSIRSVSRETGISRNTLRKYLTDASPPSYQRTKPIIQHKLKDYEGGVLGIFRPKTTKNAEAPAPQSLQEGITFS